MLTFRYRVVNQVWNYCGDVRQQARRWPTAFDLIQLTRASRQLGLHSDSIAAVCRQFARSRNQCKIRPPWRKSAGAKRSLGWVPFNAPRAIQLAGAAAVFQHRR